MKRHGRTSDGRHESGFTLIEVMIAMAILGVGLMSIAVAQLTALKVSSRSKNLQQAMFLAREQMDDLEALPPGAAMLQTAATTDDPGNPIRLSTNDGNQMTFTRSVTVTPNTPEVGLSQVVVTVIWDAPQSGVRQVQLTSVKRAN
jgi:prepilin-type N-terminal cleavage/methylation domain-containing protein